jgi:monofunctional biosynthetic peptidoglycan transglycosylase
MFRSSLFWSDYPRKRTRRRKPPGRLGATIKGAGLLLAGLLVVLLTIIVLLRWVPVPTSAFMLIQKINGNSVEYRWTPLKKISAELPIAVVASEDQRFPDHWGFDFQAIADAMQENHRRSLPRGASTISQQVAKNLFLWPGRSWLRKGLEAALTVAIEVCWPKRRILEVYLNIAQFGPHTFGADAASRRFFGQPPARLNRHQASLLAAVLPNPKAYRAAPPSPYVDQRAEEIRTQVSLLGGPAYLAGVAK